MADLNLIKNKIEEVRKNSKKRNFVQTFDGIINLKQLDPKNPAHKVDLGITINSPMKNKPLKVVVFLEREVPNAKEAFDKIIFKNELEEYKNNFSKIKELYQKYDKFIVYAQIMPIFAQIFGRYLGPLNKMPNPRLGHIINDKTDVLSLRDKLEKTVQLQNKKSNVLQFSFGSEKLDDELLASNFKTILETLEMHLPAQKNNIKSVFVKSTMGKPVRLEKW